MQNYDEDSDKGYLLEVDVGDLKELQKEHINLLFLPERMKIDKCEKHECNLYDNKNYFIDIRALKQALGHGLILKKVYWVTKSNQEAWLNPYTDMNTELR